MARRRRQRSNGRNNREERPDWRRTVFIVFGVLIVLSMALSLVAPLLSGGF